jgi:hypothetical protein
VGTGGASVRTEAISGLGVLETDAEWAWVTWASDEAGQSVMVGGEYLRFPADTIFERPQTAAGTRRDWRAASHRGGAWQEDAAPRVTGGQE